MICGRSGPTFSLARLSQNPQRAERRLFCARGRKLTARTNQRFRFRRHPRVILSDLSPPTANRWPLSVLTGIPLLASHGTFALSFSPILDQIEIRHSKARPSHLAGASKHHRPAEVCTMTNENNGPIASQSSDKGNTIASIYRSHMGTLAVPEAISDCAAGSHARNIQVTRWTGVSMLNHSPSKPR